MFKEDEKELGFFDRLRKTFNEKTEFGIRGTALKILYEIIDISDKSLPEHQKGKNSIKNHAHILDHFSKILEVAFNNAGTSYEVYTRLNDTQKNDFRKEVAKHLFNVIDSLGDTSYTHYYNNWSGEGTNQKKGNGLIRNSKYYDMGLSAGTSYYSVNFPSGFFSSNKNFTAAVKGAVNNSKICTIQKYLDFCKHCLEQNIPTDIIKHIGEIFIKISQQNSSETSVLSKP